MKNRLLAVKLRMEQVKLRQLETSLPTYLLGSYTPLPDDTLVHLRPPPQLNMDHEYDRIKLAHAPTLGLAPPEEPLQEASEVEIEVETEPDALPVYVPNHPTQEKRPTPNLGR